MQRDCKASYGRHGNTVRPHKDGPARRTGYQSWGQFENIHHERASQQVTDLTKEHLHAIISVFQSLACVPVTLYRPRGQHLAYCDTSEHNDRQRGDTLSLFRFRSPHRAALLIRTDIFLYISLVSYRGIALLPISVHPPTRDGCSPILRVYVWTTNGTAREGVLPYSILECHEWRVIGLLDVIVCGLDKGQVLCSPRFDQNSYSATACRSAKDCRVLTPSEAMEMARGNPPPSSPSKWIALGWDGNWAGLYGWMLVHVLIGDGTVGRVHLYSRMVEEHPTRATAVRDQSDLQCVNLEDLLRASDWMGRLRARDPQGTS